MKIVVIGGSGLIGKKLVNNLRNEGHEVMAASPNSGVNSVTGDYSRGASGFWIENGTITYPVSEVTIAGHLIEMFKSLAVANDLEFRYGVNAPTLRIEGLTLGGR